MDVWQCGLHQGDSLFNDGNQTAFFHPKTEDKFVYMTGVGKKTIKQILLNTYEYNEITANLHIE